MTATLTSGERMTRRSLAAPLACGCCLLAGTAYVVANDPAEGGVFLPCPFRTLTGWWCPGCGLTRATHHLLHGHVVQALRLNAFVVPVLIVLAVVWLAWLAASTGRSIGRLLSIPTWTYAVAIAALVAFGVVRNLPGVAGLRG
jgi:hypothetical protein